MTSAIDPNKPADGEPAVKADLRANLAAAKAELEHGGFALGLTPANYGPPASAKVSDHLVAVDAALGLGGGGGAAFTALTDTPASYAGHADKFVKVKAAADGLEFVTSSVSANADAVAYDPPLTGVVSRSAESRLMEVLSVKDFGAVGNGTADDTAAVQAALDATRPTGDIVFFPPGVYRITSTLRIRKMDNVGGAGDAQIRLRPLSLVGVGGGEYHGNFPSGAGASLILVDFDGVGLDLTRASDDSSRAHFFGRIDGLSFHKNGNKGNSSAIHGYSFVNCRFENMQVRGFNLGVKVGDETMTAIDNGGGWYSVWRRVKFINNTTGVWCPTLMCGSRWVDCIFTAGGNGGIFGHASPGHRAGTPLTFDDCYSEGNSGHGLQFFGAQVVNINGGYFEFVDGPFIDFRTFSDSQGILNVSGCHMLRNSNGQYITVEAGNAAATVTVNLEGCDFERGGSTVQSGLVAVNIAANPGRVAIIDRGSVNFKVLASGGSGRSPVNLTNQDLGSLRAFDCACSQLYANQAGGALNGRS